MTCGHFSASSINPIDAVSPRSAIGLVAEQAAAHEWRDFPANAIAIASDGSGNMLVFLTENGECLDAVWLWDHETGERSPVAASFDELARARES